MGWQTGETFNLAGIANGVQTISFRAVDGTGNNGTITNTTVFLLADAADYDADGLTNAVEWVVYGTHPLVADTDGDGFSDGAEVEVGTDPLNAGDNLQVRADRRNILIVLIVVIGIVSGVSIFYFRLRSGHQYIPKEKNH